MKLSNTPSTLRPLFTLSAVLALAGAAWAQDGDGTQGEGPGEGPFTPCDTCDIEECEGDWTLVDDTGSSKLDTNNDSCGVIASGFGSAWVLASGYSVVGNASAYDAVFMCDISVQASANGQQYEKWRYVATNGPGTAKAEADYGLSIHGSLDLKKAASSAAVGGFVAFDSSLGVDESLELAFGKATGDGSGGSVEFPGPKGTKITITIQGGTNEGAYTAPAPAPKNGSTGEKCVEFATVQERSMGYVEAFADGGIFALDEAWATAIMGGSAMGTLSLGACCEEDH